MKSKGSLITCAKCGKIGKLCARNLCNSCYDKEIKSHKIRPCSKCGEMKPHHSNGLCTKCYGKQRTSTDDFKIRAAKYMREKRKRFPDFFKLFDRKRHQTQSRLEWKHKYEQKEHVKEKKRAYIKEYNKQNKDKRDNWGHARRSRVRGLPHDLTVAEWNEIVESHNHCCHYCGNHSDALQREHKIPVSRGGGFTKENIVPACPTCNYRKNKMTDKEFFEFLKKYPN